MLLPMKLFLPYNICYNIRTFQKLKMDGVPMSTQSENVFETADMSVGTWLLTQRVPFRGVTLKDGYTLLRFKIDDRITDLIDDFNADAECSAKEYSSNYRFLNLQAKQARRNGGAR